MSGPGDPRDWNNAWGEGESARQGGYDGPNAVPPPPNRPQLPSSRPGNRAPRLGLSTAALVLAAVPWLFWSFAVVSWIVGLLGFSWGWILIAAWLASGPVVLVRPVEEFLARYLFRLRLPTLVEEQRLRPIWQQVLGRAGLSEQRYQLWIQEADEPNALPTPGHTVAVTRWALYNLPPSHLEAVLAHELGHHAAGRDWLSLLSFWYSIPARCALIGIRALGRLMKTVPAVGCAVIGFVVIGYFGVLVAVLTFDDSLVLPFLFLTPLVAPPILAWLSRREVFQADRRAAAIGYGATLIQVLYGWQVQHQQMLGRDGNRRWQLMSSTPSPPERVRALEKLTSST
ncbi:peptidase M48 [Kribbella antibiotica]|uniref:Peptidase M48 n=1 Tax=Kribbella antibiotica TaxID=190195 RepID=A0A4R4YHA0_9ACTN|nr:M48 family metalloprotease [Kribbella antibiotica]TDD43384.1 peptidase M48 [Kribbella antibiotica]